MHLLVFVYGTLRPDVPSPASLYLSARAEQLGPGRIPGLLYDMGSYPGFVYQPHARQTVRGYILRLNDATTLAELDRYEGLHEPEPEYERRLLTVGEWQAWAYCYRGPTDGLPLIAGGDYPSYYLQHPRHRAFVETGR